MPSEGLSRSDINRIALDQGIRVLKDTDEYGHLKEGVDHHPDVAKLAGTLAVTEARYIDAPEQLFGYDDTDEFRQVQLGEA